LPFSVCFKSRSNRSLSYELTVIYIPIVVSLKLSGVNRTFYSYKIKTIQQDHLVIIRKINGGGQERNTHTHSVPNMVLLCGLDDI
jgi:hypothetical protein